VKFLGGTDGLHLLKQQIPKTNLASVFNFQTDQLVRNVHEFFVRLQDCCISAEQYEAFVEKAKKDLTEMETQLKGDKRTDKEISLLTAARRTEFNQHLALSTAYTLFRKEKLARGMRRNDNTWFWHRRTDFLLNCRE